MGVLGNMLGMGVTVQLLDMFSKTATNVARNSRSLSRGITEDAQATNKAYGMLFAGAGIAMGGAGVLGLFAALGRKAVEASSNLEIYRNQFNLLIKDQIDSARLYATVVKFAVTTPFTIPQVVQGGKSLLVFGMQVKQVAHELQVAGDWAAAFQDKTDITETTRLLGQVYAGNYGRASIRMRNLGVNTKDVWDEAKRQGVYSDLFNKNGGTIRGYSGDKMIAVMDVVLQRYKGMMEKMMSTIPGMASNVQDQFILVLASIGDKIKPAIKNFLKVILKDMSGDAMRNLGTAIGMGLDMMLKVLLAILLPLEKVVIWLGNISKNAPGIVATGVALTGLAATVVMLAGAWVVLVAVQRLWTAYEMTTKVTKLGTSLWKFATGPLLWIAVVVGLLYSAWNSNFLGMRDILKMWYDYAALAFSAMNEGFTSIKNGVITLSEDTYNSLQNAGIADFVINLMATLYRGWIFLDGFIAGLMGVITTITTILGPVVGSVVFWVMDLVLGLLKIVGLMDKTVNSQTVNTWRDLGRVVGVVVGIMSAYWVVTKLIATAKGIATAAELLWLAVSWGSGSYLRLKLIPLLVTYATKISAATTALKTMTAAHAAALGTAGAMVAVVASGVIQVMFLTKNWDSLNLKFRESNDLLRTMFAVFAPIMGLPLMFAYVWREVKVGWTSFAIWFQYTWDKVIANVTNKLISMIVFMARALSRVSGFMPAWAKPDWIKNLNPDKLEASLRESAGHLLTKQGQQDKLQGIYAGIAGQSAKTNAANKKALTIQPGETKIMLDGRVLGKAVTTFQLQEVASGRGDF